MKTTGAEAMQLTEVVANYLCGNYNCDSYLRAVKISFLASVFSEENMYKIDNHKCRECNIDLEIVSIKGKLL